MEKEEKKKMKTRTLNKINNWLKRGKTYFIHIVMNSNSMLIINWQEKKEKY